MDFSILFDRAFVSPVCRIVEHSDDCRAQKLHPGPNRPLIDLMQPTENQPRKGRVFFGARGGLHHVYHWPANGRKRFLRPTAGSPDTLAELGAALAAVECGGRRRGSRSHGAGVIMG